MEEIWKDVIGYEGFYQVSSFGQVRSLSRTAKVLSGAKRLVRERILKQTNTIYRTVHLSKNNVTDVMLVHRLVATAFIPNPENKRCVNHKDGNKYNNYASNLEWATDKENNTHAILNGFVKAPIYFTKKVIDTESGVIYSSAKEAALAFGLNHKTLCNMLNPNFKHRNKTPLIYA